MRPIHIIFIGLAIAAFVWLRATNRKPPSGSAPGWIEYNGEPIKLKKQYNEYDDYKNDPDNLAAGESPKVQQLVQSCPIAKEFSDRKQMIEAVSAIQFPGYGMTAYGEQPQPDGSVLVLSSIEIPQSGNDRFILFELRGGIYTLIDDFVYSDSKPVAQVAARGEKLVYSSPHGDTVVERPRVRR